VETLRLQQLPLAAEVPEHPEALEWLAPYASRSPLQALGYAPVRLPRESALGGDSPLGNLSADELRRAARSDVFILNSSGARTDIEAGLVLASALQLSFPFAERVLKVWTSGAALKLALQRSLRKTGPDCASALQVSGLRLRARCSGCSSQLAGCFDALQPVPGVGDVPLRDDQIISVGLPEYLLQPGADFEEWSTLASEPVALRLPDALAQGLLARKPCPEATLDECAEWLMALPQAACTDVFALACPTNLRSARTLCAALPCITGARDGRIQLLP
jgi:hypothetical protein